MRQDFSLNLLKIFNKFCNYEFLFIKFVVDNAKNTKQCTLLYPYVGKGNFNS